MASAGVSAQLRQRLSTHAPWLLLVALSAYLLWPVPAGVMPRSADHPVHLTRAFLWADVLAHGDLRGWRATWFAGAPVGEFYPILGDAIVVAVRTATLGLLSWHQSYAVAFFGIYTATGLCLLRCGHALGFGALPGLVAAALLLVDVGAYREGGWIYTVEYGVWPQALATALAYWAFAELHLGAVEAEAHPGRLRARACVATCAALLAHPMAMLMFALGVPLLILAQARRMGLARSAARTGVPALIGLALAAWWLAPMLANRSWMASYGWLWASTERMLRWAAQGALTHGMPPVVGYATVLVTLWVGLRGAPFARFVAAFAWLQWLLSTRDIFWGLRLDWLSEGFTHLQYQRFLLGAKPGFMLLAGLAIAGLWRLAHAAAPPSARPEIATSPAGAHKDSTRTIGLRLAAGALAIAMAWGAYGTASTHAVGRVQTDRRADGAVGDDVARDTSQWLREHAQGQRVAFIGPRNEHDFMDLPVLAPGLRLYKAGFTPGDNFVHKPERRSAAVLDALGVTHTIQRGGARGGEVARFGTWGIRARTTAKPLAWIRGNGDVTAIEDRQDEGVVSFSVAGTDASSRLMLGVAGHSRWHLTRAGEPVEWFEAAIVGDARATLEDRRTGKLRGGKAHGDDGSEPTLIAVDGPLSGDYTLRYATWTTPDIVGAIISLLGVALLLLTRRGRGRFTLAVAAGLARLERLPRVAFVGLALCALGLAVARYSSAAARERGLASRQLAASRASGMSAGPLKTDMLIRPAIVSTRRKRPSRAVWPGITLDRLTGWAALDDDGAKRGHTPTRTLVLTAVAADGQEHELLDLQLPRKPGRVPIDVPVPAQLPRPFELHATMRAEPKAPPAGFQLNLGAQP